MAKDPEDRWQTARDICSELRWIAETVSQTSSLSATPRGVVSLRRVLGLGLGMLLLGAVIAGVVTWNLKSTPASPPLPVTRTIISLPAGTELAGLNRPAVAISPDGKQLAYIAARGGENQKLYVRSMDAFDARVLPGTDGAINPFFSPDGQWVGFSSENELKKVPVSGGAVQKVGGSGISSGASWSSEGTIALAPDLAAGLQQLPDAGGAPKALTRLQDGESSHGWPEFLPGDQAVLFVAASSGTDWSAAKIAIHRATWFMLREPL
jgi:hypothetical protein